MWSRDVAAGFEWGLARSPFGSGPEPIGKVSSYMQNPRPKLTCRMVDHLLLCGCSSTRTNLQFSGNIARHFSVFGGVTAVPEDVGFAGVPELPTD
jgi:hypothetical protein